ncbi:hypothetical protein PABG_12150 [Paracoccidioides brasiliensis Pb03]|nr:hypothetical protein PABG_12150 [Paracoccidioides brasiliensis Pb03]
MNGAAGRSRDHNVHSRQPDISRWMMQQKMFLFLTINHWKTAKKYEIDQSTLLRHHKGQQLSKTEAISKGKKSLTNSQDTLIQYINHLAACGLSPTPQIIQNLVFEITKQESGINWVFYFCKHHSDKLKSVYL